MILVCQQPNYFPWLGYFEQMRAADAFLFLDSVQWIRQGRQHRTRIASQPGRAAPFQWLTLPTLGHGHRDKPLKDLKLDGKNWAKVHWKSIQATYASAPHFRTQLEPLLAPWFAEAPRFRFMAEAAESSVLLLSDYFRLRPNIGRSSAFPDFGPKSDRLVGLCSLIGADTYYTALGTATYLDYHAFRGNDVRVVQQNWKQPLYDRRPGEDPLRAPIYSALDALAWVQVDEIKRWLEPKPWGPFSANADIDGIISSSRL